MFVEGASGVIFSVDRKRADTGDGAGLHRTLHCVFTQPNPDALPLPGDANGKPGRQHDRHGMMRQSSGESFWRFIVGNIANRQRVIADNRVIGDGDVGLRSIGLLVLEGISNQKAVEQLLTTIEVVKSMTGCKMFDPKIGHFSNTLGSSNRRRRRGRSRGGASSAAWNASHCSSLSTMRWRIASVSSARASALSTTNSLTERLAAAA